MFPDVRPLFGRGGRVDHQGTEAYEGHWQRTPEGSMLTCRVSFSTRLSRGVAR
ncbi:hypothetical protein [Microbispora sp. NPDC049633]|uniref:hypothetical protein n=1 Tax=Microbispora sp. NPDC049633 TaxID=3154355 RepID=UPI00341A4E59